MSEKSKNTNEVDIFRDTPVRFLGYANEVGEAFRSLVSKTIVHGSYAVAFGYVFMDVIDKARKTLRIENEKRSISPYNQTSKVGVDCFVWQTFASVLIPGFTINRICFTSLLLLNKVNKNNLRFNKILTTAIGLGSIPIIIHPIDHFCHQVMDKTLRPVLGIEPHLEKAK
jgi:fission process protein 1